MEYFLLLLFILMSFSIVLGETAEYLTPDQLFKEALNRNPYLRSLQYRVESVEYSKKAAGILMDPRIKFEIQRLPASKPYDLMHTEMYMISIEQEIILPPRLKLLSEIEDYEFNKSEMMYYKAKLDTELKIYNLFFRYHYLYNREKILISEQNLLYQMRETMKSRYITSQIMQTDLMYLEAEILMIENEILNIRKDISNIKAEINFILAKSPESEIPKPSDYEVIRPEINLENIEVLIRSRPEIKISELEIKKKEEMKRLKDISGKVPDIEVSAGYQFSPLMEDGFYLMISLNIPWINKRNKYEYKMIEKMYLEEKEMYQDKVNMTASEIYSLYDKLNRMYEIVLNLDKIILIRQQAFDTELSMYEKSQTIYLSLIESLRGLYRAKLEYLSMKSEYFMTYIDLLRCCGLSVKSSFVKKEGKK